MDPKKLAAQRSFAPVLLALTLLAGCADRDREIEVSSSAGGSSEEVAEISAVVISYSNALWTADYETAYALTASSCDPVSLELFSQSARNTMILFAGADSTGRLDRLPELSAVTIERLDDDSARTRSDFDDRDGGTMELIRSEDSWRVDSCFFAMGSLDEVIFPDE